ARIGSYEVIDRLGAGGMGEVYRARDTRLGRTVAIKVLRSGADPQLLQRLDREARAASALNHPNIVHIYDVGEAADVPGAHYVVMEHVEGETLRRRLRPGPLPLSEVLDLGAQLADGLAKAHRAGIVHRDLKPENLSRQGGTQAGMLVGTLEYMSPEQASGRTVDHRTDQFSLGLILYEMAAGRAAFRRDTPAQVLAAVIEREPEPSSRLRGDVPPALEALVSRCLQKDPERRFKKTDELSVELAALAGRSRSGSLAEKPRFAADTSPALSAEVVPARPPTTAAPAAPPVYHVQTRRRVKAYDEGELTHLIRRGKLTGVELVRRDDEEQWQPLFESKVYRREVPTLTDPRDAARMRVLRAVGGHFTGFFITCVVMYATQGHFPFWLAIWGAVLAMQAVGAIPAGVTLLRQRREDPAAVGTAPDAAPAALPARVLSPIEQE